MKEFSGNWWHNALRGHGQYMTRFIYRGNLNMPLITKLENYLQVKEFSIDTMFQIMKQVENEGCKITYIHKEIEA